MENIQKLTAGGVNLTLTLTGTQILSSLCAVVITWYSVKLGYSFVLAQRERPVEFSFPLPRELSPDWVGRKWSDVGDKGKEILESQSHGVSVIPLHTHF